MTNVSPWIALLALTASVAGPVGLNLWLWRRDRQRALQLASEITVPTPFRRHELTQRVSILVAAWNEAALIVRCLEAIGRLSYADFEVVVCAGGADGTYGLAAGQSSEKVKVIEQWTGEGKQHALQRCFEASTGSIIYLIDADCIIADLIFRQCLAPILRDGETVVTGSFYMALPEQLDNPFVLGHMVSQAYAAAVQPKYATGLLGGNCVMRREILSQAGAFTNPVRTGTDYDLAKRLLVTGHRIRYVAQAYIQSELPTDAKAYFQQQARWIRNVVIHGMRYQAYSEVLICLRTSIIGVAMLAGLTAVILLALWHGPVNMLTLAAFAPWLAMFTQAMAARVRYQRFTAMWLGLKAARRMQWRLPAWILLDFIAWSLPVLEYPFQPLRARW